MIRFGRRGWAALALALASSLSAQTSPDCLIPDQGGNAFRYLWGGEIRQVVARPVGNGVGIWTAEDGGRIRHSADGGVSWVFQGVPKTASQTLLDVWMLPDGQTGWACGRGGRVLQTKSAGVPWSFLDPAFDVVPNDLGEPAVLWGVRFLADDTDRGWLCGNRIFAETTNGGQGAGGWTEVSIFDPTVTIQLDQHDFEFYRVEVHGDSSHWVGNLCGEWKWNTPTGSELGVVLHTDTSDPLSQGGARWWITFCSDFFPGTTMIEPWDLEMDESAPDPSQAAGIVVGGLGVGDGAVFTTTDGGLTWTEELPAAGEDDWTTLYGVEWLDTGEALAAGYTGHVWARDPATGDWTQKSVPTFVGPLAAAGGLPNGPIWVAGSWGFFRSTSDLGDSWEYQNPIYDDVHPEVEWRLEDVAFRKSQPDTGFVVGQFELIARTDDAGCSWDALQGGPDAPLPGSLQAIELAQDTWGVATGQKSPTGGTPLYHSPDGGDTWTPASFTFAEPDWITLHDVTHLGAGEFLAVGTQGFPADTAFCVHSADGGATWSDVTPPSTGAHLFTCDAASATAGFVAGCEGDDAKAWRYSRSGATYQWFDVSPIPAPDPPSEPRWFCKVRVRGPSGTGTVPEVYAVGGPGIVMRYHPGQDRFLGIPGVYELDPDGSVAFQILEQELTCLALAPSNTGLILVGPEADQDLDISEELGLALRRQAGVWETVKANTNKNMRAIEFVGANRAMCVCRPRPEDEDASLGTVNDSTLIFYRTPLSSADVGVGP